MHGGGQHRKPGLVLSAHCQSGNPEALLDTERMGAVLFCAPACLLKGKGNTGTLIVLRTESLNPLAQTQGTSDMSLGFFNRTTKRWRMGKKDVSGIAFVNSYRCRPNQPYSSQNIKCVGVSEFCLTGPGAFLVQHGRGQLAGPSLLLDLYSRKPYSPR